MQVDSKLSPSTIILGEHSTEENKQVQTGDTSSNSSNQTSGGWSWLNKVGGGLQAVIDVFIPLPPDSPSFEKKKIKTKPTSQPTATVSKTTEVAETVVVFQNVETTDAAPAELSSDLNVETTDAAPAELSSDLLDEDNLPENGGALITNFDDLKTDSTDSTPPPVVIPEEEATLPEASATNLVPEPSNSILPRDFDDLETDSTDSTPPPVVIPEAGDMILANIKTEDPTTDTVDVLPAGEEERRTNLEELLTKNLEFLNSIQNFREINLQKFSLNEVHQLNLAVDAICCAIKGEKLIPFAPPPPPLVSKPQQKNNPSVSGQQEESRKNVSAMLEKAKKNDKGAPQVGADLNAITNAKSNLKKTSPVSAEDKSGAKNENSESQLFGVPKKTSPVPAEDKSTTENQNPESEVSGVPKKTSPVPAEDKSATENQNPESEVSGVLKPVDLKTLDVSSAESPLPSPPIKQSSIDAKSYWAQVQKKIEQAQKANSTQNQRVSSKRPPPKQPVPRVLGSSDPTLQALQPSVETKKEALEQETADTPQVSLGVTTEPAN